MSLIPSPTDQRRNANIFGPVLLGALLLFVLAVALRLRWRYVIEISLYVDEFTTLWGAKRIHELGAPILPSGVLYTRGILNTYITALFTAVGGMSYPVGRMPSVIFGIAAIIAVFAAGRREWNARVGLLAAVGLTLLVEAIQWSGRARFYAQLLLFVLLMVWAAYSAIRPARDGEEPGPATWRGHLLFAGLFTLALFSQEETLLLYPTLVLAIIWWRGWRYLLQRPVLVSQIIAGAAMVARYLIEVVGQPGYFETIQSERPYVGFSFDVADAWRMYGPLLIDPDRLLWTIGAVVALSVAVIALSRLRWQPLALPRFHQASLFFGLQFVGVLGILLGLVGGTWREGRYLLLAQPLWLLAGAAGMVVAIDRLLARSIWRWVCTVVVAAALATLMWQPAQILLAHQSEGYDKVLAYVAANRQPGDVIMSPQPPACALVMGAPCDYYATQRGWEAYVIVGPNGTLIDRWSGAPLLADPMQLEQVIRTAPRVWMVADGQRLGRRYREEYVRTLVEQFDVAYEMQGTVALLAQGWRDLPPPIAEKTLEPPLAIGPLDLDGWERGPAQPDAPLTMTLFWSKRDFINQQINTSLQLVAADGSRITQSDGPPARGMIPTFSVETAQVPDPKTLYLPPLAPGRYRLDVVAYDATTFEPLADPLALAWFWVGDPPSPPNAIVDADWQNGITLVGHDGWPQTLIPGATVTQRLVWRAASPIQGDNTVFVQIIGPDGNIIAQSDREPEGGFYPTSAWQPDELVTDSYSLTLPPALAPGAYSVLVGLYDPVSGVRVPLAEGGDALEVARLEVR